MDRAWLLHLMRENKYLLLLLSLLLLAVVDPLVERTSLPILILNLLLCVVVAAAVYALSQQRRPFLGTLVLGGMALGGIWASYFTEGAAADIHYYAVVIRFLAYVTFLILVVVLILRDVLQNGEVTANRLYGSICVYLLLGVVWATVYALIAFSQPGSFTIAQSYLPLEDHAGLGYHRFSIFLYHSYVTLTTLGYGDVSPVSEVARTFSWLEAVVGQLYLAVLIARLVGLYIIHHERQ